MIATADPGRRRTRRTWEERFVAFVDILGFKDLVNRMHDEPRLYLMVRNALDSIDAQARRIDKFRLRMRQRRTAAKKSHGGIFLMSPPRLEMTAFSDCYLISEKFPAWHVVAAVQALAAKFLEQGILSRGAIVHGLAYHRKGIAFGPAILHGRPNLCCLRKNARRFITSASLAANFV
jgi:hypothetical protein